MKQKKGALDMDFEECLENEPVKVLNNVIAMQIEYLDNVADCEIREKEMKNLIELLELRVGRW